MEYTEDFKKLHISDEAYDSLTKNHQPYVATFELTPKCNFRCIHCYLGTHRDINDTLTYNDVIHILDELKIAGVIQLALTGGECTLRKDFVDIYKYAKKNGFVVTVFSNASNITEEIVEVFKEYPPFSVEISLYGASDNTYEIITGVRCFDKVIENLNRLHREGINLSIKAPLMKQNIHDETKLKTISNSYNKALRVGTVLNPTIDKEKYTEEYALNLKERFEYEVNANPNRELNVDISETVNRCGEVYDRGEFVPLFICNPGVTDVFVDYKGNACPCIGYRSKGRSLLEYGFNEIWDSFRNIKEIPSPKDYRCMRCDSRFFCPICIGEQDEVYGDMCHIPIKECIYSHARKKYYIDGADVRTIIEYISEREELLINKEIGSAE